MEAVLTGLATLAILLLVSIAVRYLVRVFMTWRGRSKSSARVFGRLAGWLMVGVAIIASLTVTFPSIRPVDVVGGVGVISIAAGIAFQTVLGNMFAGIVILARDLFRVGDQIQVNEHAGTIRKLDLTASTLRTFDGRLVVIPNGVLHSAIVTVQTGYANVRTAVEIDLDMAADIDEARDAALDVMHRLDCVLDTPAPDALAKSVGDERVTLELRFWSGALQLETRAAQHEVIKETLREFTKRSIPLPSAATTLDATARLRAALASVPDSAVDPRGEDDSASVR